MSTKRWHFWQVPFVCLFLYASSYWILPLLASIITPSSDNAHEDIVLDGKLSAFQADYNLCNQSTLFRKQISRLFCLGSIVLFSMSGNTTPISLGEKTHKFQVYDTTNGKITSAIDLNETFVDAKLKFADFISGTRLQYVANKCLKQPHLLGCYLNGDLHNNILLIGSQQILFGIYPQTVLNSALLRLNSSGQWSHVINDLNLTRNLRFGPNQLVKSVSYDDNLGRICFLTTEAKYSIVLDLTTNQAIDNNYTEVILCKYIDSKTGTFQTTPFERYSIQTIVQNKISLFYFNNKTYLATSQSNVYEIEFTSTIPSFSEQVNSKSVQINQRFTYYYLFNCYGNSTLLNPFNKYSDYLTLQSTNQVSINYRTNDYSVWIVWLVVLGSVLVAFLVLCLCCLSNTWVELEPSDERNPDRPYHKQISS